MDLAEAGGEFRPDFIGRTADRGPEHRDDVPPGCAKRLHGGERRFKNAGEGAFPTGMRRADHACGRVGEKHWAAIGGADGKRQARNARHHRIGAGALG